MKRPWLVRILVALQALPVLLTVGATAFAWWEILQPVNIIFRSRLPLMFLVENVVGVVGVLFFYSPYLMWIGRRSGWFLSVILNTACAGLFCWDPFNSDGTLAWDDIGTALWCVVMLVLLFLPAVRRFVHQCDPDSRTGQIPAQNMMV